MNELYYRLQISTDRPVNDLIVGFLSNAGAEGFVEEGNELSCYFETTRWKSTFETDIKSFLKSLKSQGKIGKFSVGVSQVHNQDWNQQWEDSILPVEVTNDIVIKPSWKTYAGSARLVIEIDPKMSFGTGHHETTRMMVQMLSSCIEGGEKVLDVGTGTGVLAITAIKLGAESCIALDRDEWSIRNAEENIERNRVSDKIRIVKGEIDSIKQEEFDVISANLNRNALLYIRDALSNRCKKGGRLLLTGILAIDEKNVTDSFEEIGFSLTDVKHEAEWSALAMTK